MDCTGQDAFAELEMDPYNEDEAELRYLLSKPTCFIVLGKPGAGKSALARQLAQQWKCEIINATDVIQAAIEMLTELGQKAQEILLMGEALSESMVCKMIEEKINSPEVAHYGYVLDGLPSLSEDYMSIRDQLDLIKNWRLQPDFVINLKIPDKDLETRRTGMRVDPMTGEMYTKEVYNPEKPETKESESKQNDEEEMEEEEEEDEAAEEEEIPEGLPSEVVERLVRRPEDLVMGVQEHIQEFKSNMLRELEDYMADHDQQYLIELDANKPNLIIFKELMMRLSCFVLRPAAVPIRLLDGETEEELPEDIDTDEMVRSLAGKKMIAPRYRWRRSRWLRNCPVSLAEGSLVPGKPEFAVSFLDKIYTMAHAHAMEKFLKNPRKYLMPPQPRPPCKVCVTGPPCSGKTTMSAILAEKYGAKVLNMDELIKTTMEEEKRKKIEASQAFALMDAIQIVKMRIQEQQRAAAAANAETSESEVPSKETEEAGQDESKTEETKTEEAKTEEGNAEEEKEAEDQKTEVTESVADDAKTEDTKTEGEETIRTDDQTAEIESTILATTTDGTRTEPPDAGEALAPDQAEPTEASSVTTATDPPEIEVNADHPEVKVILQAVAQKVEKETIELRSEVWLEVMEKAVQELELENQKLNPDGPFNGGWILDNFPRTRDQWSLMIERGIILPDSVISLNDDSPGGHFLLKRWYKVNKDDIDAKVQARKEVEEAARMRREEEERRAQEEAKRAAEEEEQRLAEEERLKKIEEDSDKAEEGAPQEPMQFAGEPGSLPEPPPEVTEQEAAEKPQDDSQEQKEDDQDEKQNEAAEEQRAPTQAMTEITEETVFTETTVEQVEPEEQKPKVAQDPMPPEGPETDDIINERRLFDNEWPSAAALLSGSTTIDPISLDITQTTEDGAWMPRSEDSIIEEVVTSMEKHLQYQAWELTGVDIDEEAEDNDAEQELLAAEAAEEEEEEGGEEAVEEEEEDVNRSIKKALGDTNYFCPVMLKEKSVLWPGDPEKAVKYREKTYYMSSLEARDKFLADPKTYLPQDKPLQPPPIRLLLLGPTGSGKTLHGRDLARKLGVFHIQFHERLQEMLLAKTRRKVGPEYNEEHEEDMKVEAEDLSELEAEVAAAVAAITDPQGNPVPVSDEEAKAKEKPEQGDQKKQGEEEEEIKYTEDEEAIKGYLENEETLPTELLDKIVNDWWNKEPFKSTGFVIEGFPRTAEEAEHMVGRGLYPDAAVLLAVEDTDVIGRLLPSRMDIWHARRAKVLAKRERRKQLKQQKVDAEKSKKRSELLKEQEERRAERRAQKEQEAKERGSEDEEEAEEEEEEEEEEDIEALLAEEFDVEEEEEEEELEHEDDAMDRIKNRLAEIYDNDINRLASIQEKFEDALIPRMEIQAAHKPHIVRYLISKKLRKTVQYRHSLFERVYPISEKLATEMLQIGYKQPSRFGRWCPVKLEEGDCLQPMHGPEHPSFPAIYRQHIYFLSSASAREQFQQEPMNFLTQPSPKPVVPMRMAIVGPPKSGKTFLAKRFAKEYGMVRLSIGEALRQLMEFQPKSELAKSIKVQLFKGRTVPEELAVQALAVALMDMRCQTRGYILDGCPTTRKQAELMREQNIMPVRMLELEVDSKEIVTRATMDRYGAERTHPVHDSHEIFAAKLGNYKREVPSIREFYTEDHDNWTPVHGKRSKWWVWNECTKIGKETVVTIQTYLQRISEGKAAGIADMCITPTQFEQRLGDFGQYCPVSLADKGELVDCSVTKSLKYAAEFQGHYYKLEGEQELQTFLAEPEKYVPPLAPTKLPPTDMLPKRLTGQQAKEMFPKIVELLGYCPVTFLDGKFRYEAIVPGNPELVVEYRDKLYYMEAEEKLQKFMRLPEKYWQLKLPHKLPPKKEPVELTTLPMLGYMEQTVAQGITKALTAVGNFKPKYPFLTSSRSALVYVAFHLKAYNPKNSEYIRKKYRKKLMQFEETCKLIQYLGDTMTRRYKEPVDRPQEFDFKLEKFIHLKETEPMMSWIA